MKALIPIVTILCGVSGAFAADAPRVEFFGGYSYFHLNGADPEGVNAHGWNTSLAGNVNPWLGFVADFSGHRDSLSFAEPVFGSFSSDRDINLFLFGPRFTLRKSERVQPFAHVLAGVARADIRTSLASLGPFGATLNAFASAAGGGLDVRAGDHFAIRALQADYVYTRFGDQGQNSVRLSFGVVFRFGRAD